MSVCPPVCMGTGNVIHKIRFGPEEKLSYILNISKEMIHYIIGIKWEKVKIC